MRLNVRELQKQDRLADGRSGAWGWSNSHTGERTGTIWVSVSDGVMTLDYSLNDEPRVQRVSLLQTPCHFGGSRQWFGCPHCWQRVGVLYLRRGGFYCRKCARVAYSSQSESLVDRTWRAQRKIEQRLGDDLERPKGMHHSTYERLLDGLDRYEQIRDDSLGALLARVLACR